MNKRTTSQQNSHNNKKIRLNKFLADCGIASRRKAEKLIQEGKIKVNGEVVSDLAIKVNEDDRVEYCGRPLKKQEQVYIMLNKPKDFLTTTNDPKNRNKVTDLIKDKKLPKLFPIGRLDRNTSGILILTNNGELANKLMHPSRNVEKMYKVTLDKPFPKKNLETLLKGIYVKNHFIKPNSIMYQSPQEKNKLVLSIHTGQYRIVRRMFKTMGYYVKNLDRIYYGGIKKEKLKPGQWRHLTKKEVNILKNQAGINQS